jgi:hypothetical protein
LEIILQGAFEQGGDLIGVVAERTTAPGSEDDLTNLNSIAVARIGVRSLRIISDKSGAVSARSVYGMVSIHDTSRSNPYGNCPGGRGERLSGGGERGCGVEDLGGVPDCARGE